MFDKLKKFWPLIVVIIVIPTWIVIMSDNGKIKTSLDGAIVTDKAGKAYMLQSGGILGSSYKAYEFDIEKMRLIR